jgi:hypothetical protein
MTTADLCLPSQDTCGRRVSSDPLAVAVNGGWSLSFYYNYTGSKTFVDVRGLYALHKLGWRFTHANFEGREEYERAIQTRKDWVVWSRARPTKGVCTPRGFE